MVDDRRPIGSPFDDGKLLLVREFLRREFRDCLHRDFFAFDQTAQVFLIETGRGSRLTLVIPKATFDHPDLPWLCNAHLAVTLKLAPQGRVILTPQGTEVRP